MHLSNPHIRLVATAAAVVLGASAPGAATAANDLADGDSASPAIVLAGLGAGRQRFIPGVTDSGTGVLRERERRARSSGPPPTRPVPASTSSATPAPLHRSRARGGGRRRVTALGAGARRRRIATSTTPRRGCGRERSKQMTHTPSRRRCRRRTFGRVKQRQQQAWASGDYHAVAARIMVVAERLVDAADLHAGWRVLDVATGSGNAAIAAARLGCEAVGRRLRAVPARAGRQRAAAEGLTVELAGGRRRGAPVRGRLVRRRHVRLRLDVRARPRARGRGAAPRHPPGRDDRARELDAGRVPRRLLPDDGGARAAAGRASGRRCSGGPRATSATCSATASPRSTRSSGRSRSGSRSAEEFVSFFRDVVRPDPEGVRSRSRTRPARRSSGTSWRWRAGTTGSAPTRSRSRRPTSRPSRSGAEQSPSAAAHEKPPRERGFFHGATRTADDEAPKRG